MKKLRRYRLDIDEYYLLSMGLIFMFFYSVLILTNSKRIYELAENMKILKDMLPVVVVLAFIISIKYAIDGIRDIIIKDKDKLGIYVLAGNKNKTLSYMIALDMVKNLVFSSIMGIFLGVIYSYLIAKMLQSVFGISDLSFEMINLNILIKYIGLFLLVLVLNYLVVNSLLRKKDIKSLLYNEDTLELEESIYKKSDKKYHIITLFSALFSLFFLKLFKENPGDNISLVYILFLLVFFSIFIYRITKTGWEYKIYLNKKLGENDLFTYLYSREVNRNWKNYSRNQSGYIMILVLACLILFLALTIGYSYKENISKEAPFDLLVAIDSNKVNFDEIRNYIGSDEIDKSLEYKIYTSYELRKYNLPDQCMKLSDYNYLIKMLGREPVNLLENNYLIQVEDDYIREKIEKELDLDKEIEINGKNYLSAGEIQMFPFSQGNINGNFSLTVLNDGDIDKLKASPIRSVFIAQLKNKADPDMKNQIYDLINSPSGIIREEKSEDTHITIKVILKEWSRLNGLVGLSALTIFGIFVSSLLILLSISSIGFFTVKNIEKINKENKIYSELGFSANTIYQYNKFRIKENKKIAIFLVLITLLTVSFAIYFYFNKYFDKDYFIFIFALLTFAFYMLITFLYEIGLTSYIRKYIK